MVVKALHNKLFCFPTFCNSKIYWGGNKQRQTYLLFNLINPNTPFLDHLKTSENCKFSDVFIGQRKGALGTNGLMYMRFLPRKTATLKFTLDKTQYYYQSFNALYPLKGKKEYILKQTCSFELYILKNLQLISYSFQLQLQVCLSMYNVLVGTRC